ncbi:MAG: HAMP domain-containing histidine kinase [Thermoleophilia bacterium]|nr:HAMP domain-containing histidine kinase [Thermoleophilia bacterium]
MSLRARLTLVAAAAVALAVVLSSALVFVVVRAQLRGEVDDALGRRAAEISRLPPDPHQIQRAFFRLRSELGGAGGYPQVVLDDGRAVRPRGAVVPLPVDERVLEVARGERGAFLADEHVAGTHVRVITFPYAGVAVQIARPLTEVDRTLARTRTFLLLIATGGIAFAVLLGLLVSRAAVAPVQRLTEATERVTETGDLSERIDAGGRSDELGRLAASFNAMLAALEESVRAQRQLVADASHELRTPLTSVRTNFEVLSSERELPADDRRRLLDDVAEQIGEMTTLIAELIEVARGDGRREEAEEVRLDLVTASAVERVSRDRPGIRFATDLHEARVHGVPARLERAVGNVVDNAAKWSPPGGEVEVTVRPGEVVVRDHGPGIDEADLPFVFDRFYRSASARDLPGSGLGLAIVRQVALAHGGDVVAERAEGGGTRVTLRLDGANGGPAAPSRDS